MTRTAVVARRTGVDLRVAAASAHGTFGELRPGPRPDATDFLPPCRSTAGLDAVRRACAGVAARVYVFPSLKLGQEGRAA